MILKKPTCTFLNHKGQFKMANSTAAKNTILGNECELPTHCFGLWGHQLQYSLERKNGRQHLFSFFKKRKRLKVVDGATKPSMTHSNIFCPFYKCGNHSLWTPIFFFLLLLSRFSFGRRNLENYVHSKFHERVLFLEFLQ